MTCFQSRVITNWIILTNIVWYSYYFITVAQEFSFTFDIGVVHLREGSVTIVIMAYKYEFKLTSDMEQEGSFLHNHKMFDVS